MRARAVLWCLGLAMAAPAWAKVAPEEALRLRTLLTPMGAERAGNVEGTIPDWTGGLAGAPACYRGAGSRYCDPFPDDKPLFTITAANIDRFRDRLSAGQLAMFYKYPQSWRMNVYAARRTAAYPAFVYDATYRNALGAELTDFGEGLVHAAIGAPFPIPHSGIEALWNHKLRYRGPGLRRWNNEVVVNSGGDYQVLKFREDARFAYSARKAEPDRLGNIATYFLQVVEQPPRLAGEVTLVQETFDQLKEPRHAWEYNPGQRRVRRAPYIGYDSPSIGTDGLRTNDQADMFNGAGDRYLWKLLGKRELYIPCNSYRLHSDRYKVRDLVGPHHLNQELARYELHRVWVVEGRLRSTTRHIYGRRVFYLDEDSWQIAVADLYDRRDQLWRWQEAHTLQAYDQPFPLPALETVYDLNSGRYLLQALNNEDPETAIRDFEPGYFSPANLEKVAVP